MVLTSLASPANAPPIPTGRLPPSTLRKAAPTVPAPSWILTALARGATVAIMRSAITITTAPLFSIIHSPF